MTQEIWFMVDFYPVVDVLFGDNSVKISVLISEYSSRSDKILVRLIHYYYSLTISVSMYFPFSVSFFPTRSKLCEYKKW